MEVIRVRIEEHDKALKELAKMSDEGFADLFSSAIFSPRSRDLYTATHEEAINKLKNIRESIDRLVDLWRNNKKILSWVIRKSYTGYIRRVTEDIQKLAESRLNTKLSEILAT